MPLNESAADFSSSIQAGRPAARIALQLGLGPQIGRHYAIGYLSPLAILREVRLFYNSAPAREIRQKWNMKLSMRAP
jgi:hypothetical protein